MPQVIESKVLDPGPSKRSHPCGADRIHAFVLIRKVPSWMNPLREAKVFPRSTRFSRCGLRSYGFAENGIVDGLGGLSMPHLLQEREFTRGCRPVSLSR